MLQGPQLPQLAALPGLVPSRHLMHVQRGYRRPQSPLVSSFGTVTSTAVYSSCCPDAAIDCQSRPSCQAFVPGTLQSFEVCISAPSCCTSTSFALARIPDSSRSGTLRAELQRKHTGKCLKGFPAMKYINSRCPVPADSVPFPVAKQLDRIPHLAGGFVLTPRKCSCALSQCTEARCHA